MFKKSIQKSYRFIKLTQGVSVKTLTHPAFLINSSILVVTAYTSYVASGSGNKQREKR